MARVIAARAAAHPDAVALVLRGERVSYRALESRATRWARALRAAGVRPGATVGLALDRSIEAIVALLAMLGGGATALAMDKTITVTVDGKDRVVHMFGGDVASMVPAAAIAHLHRAARSA